jgi:hypothetical protein
MIKRKISYKGEVSSVTGKTKNIDKNTALKVIITCDFFIGTKRDLLKKIKDYDIYFATTFHRRLNPPNIRFIESFRGGNLEMEEMGAQVIAKVGDANITRNILRQLRIASLLQEDCIYIICQLFNKRDKRICLSHYDVNGTANHYEIFRPSIFLPAIVIRLIQENPNRDDLNQYLTEGLEWQNLHRIYFTNKVGNGLDDSWNLVILDVPSLKIYYIDPKLDILLPISLETTELLTAIKTNLTTFMAKITENAGLQLTCERYPHQFFTVLQNDFDCGVYLVATLYFLVQDCPIAFIEQDMIKIRDNIAYWMLNESLPI